MADRYWVGGTDFWNSTAGTKWATTSGGVGGAAVPTSSDDVYFDAASGTFRVTVSGTRTCRRLDLSGFTGQLSNTSLGAIDRIQINGDLVLDSSTPGIAGGTWRIGFNGPRAEFRNSGTISLAGKSIDSVYLNGTTRTLLSDFNCSDIDHVLGVFDLNGFNVTSNGYSITVTVLSRTLYLRSGTFTIKTSNSWNIATTTNFIFDAGTSTINFNGPTQTASFIGGGLNYYNLNIGTATVNVSGSNTFNDITNTIQPATLLLAAGTTQTVSNFSLAGTSGSLVTLRSNSTGTQATLSKTSGAVSVEYLSVRDINVTGGAEWTFGTGSVDVSNNTGWTIPPVEVAITGTQTAGQVGELKQGAQVLGAQTDSEVGVVAAPRVFQLSGAQTTGQLGAVEAGNLASAELSGVSATGEIGTLTVIRGATQLFGVTGTSQVGTLSPTAGTIKALSGVQSTEQSGSVVASSVTTASLSGVQASGQVGTFGVISGRFVELSGVQAVGSTGFFDVGWYNISTGQTPDWSQLGTAQDPAWTSIAAPADPSWTSV